MEIKVEKMKKVKLTSKSFSPRNGNDICEDQGRMMILRVWGVKQERVVSGLKTFWGRMVNLPIWQMSGLWMSDPRGVSGSFTTVMTVSSLGFECDFCPLGDSWWFYLAPTFQTPGNRGCAGAATHWASACICSIVLPMPDEPTMKPVAAGYSGTPLPRKLGLRSGMRFVALNAPPELDAILAGAPDLHRLSRIASFDCALAFATTARALAALFNKLPPRLVDAGMI